MKELKDLAGKWVSITTIVPATVTREEICDEQGNPTRAYNEVIGEEHFVEGEVKHIAANGWIVLDCEYRSTLYTYFVNPQNVASIVNQVRTPEAQARDKLLATKRTTVKKSSKAK